MWILLCVLFLTSCSSTENYNEQLQDWVGVSEEHLVDNWGMPNSVFTIDAGTKVVTYVKFNGTGDLDAYPSLIDYQAIRTPNLPADRQGDEYCKISFTIRNSVVTGYDYNGDDCTGMILPDGNN